MISTVGYFAFVSRGGSTKQIESIAVMPFVNESGNADVEYLSDGMTETLISSLSQLRIECKGTFVRVSIQRQGNKSADDRQRVERAGNFKRRIVQRGDQLTLSLELVDVATENAIWSQQYVRKQTDLLTLQSEIARDVSSKLKTQTFRSERGEGYEELYDKPRSLSALSQRSFFLLE